MYDDPTNVTLGVVFSNATSMMNLYDVGLTSLVAADAQALIRLCKLVGNRAAAIAQLQARVDAITRDMQAHMWNATAALFLNQLYDPAHVGRGEEEEGGGGGGGGGGRQPKEIVVKR